jgi:hypothetical protein
MPALDKKKVKFKFTPEVELFVVRQYAEYVNPLNICKNLIDEFYEYCKKDIQEFGEDEFLAYLLRGRVNALSPGRKSFPKKYEQNYEDYRQTYLENLDNSYLAHRKNRMRELDKLYENLIRRLDAEQDPSQFRQGISAAKDIIKEARAEMDKAKITVEASIEEGQARVTAKREMESLSTEELKALVKNAESGKSIDITPSKPSDATGDGEGGDSSAGEGGGRTPTESD